MSEINLYVCTVYLMILNATEQCSAALAACCLLQNRVDITLLSDLMYLKPA